eukprot:357237_1
MHFKSMISECKITTNLVTKKWINSSNIKFFGYYVASLYDTNIRKWHNTLPKRKYTKRTKPPSPTESDIIENAGTEPPLSMQPSVHVSKQQYMREFDAAKNGPLHEQPFVIKELESYDKAK